jgi:hypothetical protein
MEDVSPSSSVYLVALERMKDVPLGGILGILFFIGSVYSQPANLTFGHIALEDGLSQLSVYAIVQDQTGFLWFATEDGLNRYDGYSIKTYRHNPLDSTSLSDKAIIALFADRSGDLWVGTNRGCLSVDEHWRQLVPRGLGTTINIYQRPRLQRNDSLCGNSVQWCVSFDKQWRKLD